MIVPHEKFCFDDELDLMLLDIWPRPYFCLVQIAVIDSFAKIASPRDVQDLCVFLSIFFAHLNINKQKLFPFVLMENR